MTQYGGGGEGDGRSAMSQGSMNQAWDRFSINKVQSKLQDFFI